MPERPATDKLRPVVIRLPPELHDAIKAVAAAEERSMAVTIRRALRQYIDRCRPTANRVSTPERDQP